MPEPGHRTHEQKGDPHEAGSRKNDPSRAYPVDRRSRQQTKRQSRHKKSEEEALRDLRARETKRLHKRGVKNREPIKNDTDGKEEVQERRNNNPPPVKDAR